MTVGNLDWQEKECVAPTRYGRRRQNLRRFSNGSYAVPVVNLWEDQAVKDAYNRAKTVRGAAKSMQL
jgi:hypothetical protein